MRILLGLALTASLSACTAAEWGSINRQFSPTTGDSRLIDAKQRAIISVNRTVIGADGRPIYDEKKKLVKELAVCAEPSPDALQATASALAGTGSSEAIEAVFNASASTAESVASIGLRTQTIQLLRDAYYRLCESYLNDGIDGIAYDVLQRRFQNQIIALLAVEQLTGTVTAQQAVLNTTSSADAGAQAGLIARTLDEAEEDLIQIQAEQDENEDTIQKLTTNQTTLKAATAAAIAARDKDEETKKDATLKRNVVVAESAEKSNDAQLVQAKRQKDVLAGQVARKETQISTLTVAFGEAAKSTINSSAAGIAQLSGGNVTSQAAIGSEVADAVRAITLNAINQDYEAQVCFEALRYRNHVGQYKNRVYEVFDGQSGASASADLSRRGGGFVQGGTFLDYCDNIFTQEAAIRTEQTKIVAERAKAIEKIITASTRDQNPMNSVDAANLILALEQSAPLAPGSAFLKRDLKLESTTEGKKETKSANQDVRFQPEALAAIFKKELESKGVPPDATVKTVGSTTEQKLVTPITTVTNTTLGASALSQCGPGQVMDVGQNKCVGVCVGDAAFADGACFPKCGERQEEVLNGIRQCVKAE